MACANRTLQDPEGNDIEVIEPPDDKKAAVLTFSNAKISEPDSEERDDPTIETNQ